MSRRQRRTYSKNSNNKSSISISLVSLAQKLFEYELTPSSFDKWMKQAQSTGSFKERDNLTPEQAELIALRRKISNSKWRMIF